MDTLSILCPKCDCELEIDETDPRTEVRCSCGAYLGRLGDRDVRVDAPLDIQLAGKLIGHKREVLALGFSSDGGTIASGSRDGIIKLWDVGSRKPQAVLGTHPEGAACLCTSPDGEIWASGGNDSTIRLWDVAAGKERTALDGHAQEIHGVASSPDGQWLAVASSRPRKPAIPNGASKSGSQGSLVLWDVSEHRRAQTLTADGEDFDAVAFSPDGTRVAAGHFGASGGAVTVFERATGRRVSCAERHERAVTHVAFTPDGETIVSASLDGRIKLWDAETGALKATLTPPGRDYSFQPRPVLSASLSPDGRKIAVGLGTAGAPNLLLIELTTGRLRAALTAHERAIHAVAFSPDGSLLATGSSAPDRIGVTRLWKLQIDQ